MINWISSDDEKNIRKVDYNNLCRVINFVKDQRSDNEMVKYACTIFDEYKDILSTEPKLLKESLKKYFGESFSVDSDLLSSDVILSPSDLNAYFTIKKLNEEKKNLTIVCFDLHSDTYDYNDFLWKGNSFSKLMKEGYINHYIVIGVPKEKRNNCINDTNAELRNRVHLIDSEQLYSVLENINPGNIFVSIDADCFDCRKSKYTSVEYSPATILYYISKLNINEINSDNYEQKIKECIHVKNELGYSNYYHTGENDLTSDMVIEIIDNLKVYCNANNINLGLSDGTPYFQIMEISGCDYGNLSASLVVKLIDGLSLKEVKFDGKERILKKSRKNV